MHRLLTFLLLVAPVFGAGSFAASESSADVTHASLPDYTTAHSICLWVKEASTASGSYRMIASKEDSNASRTTFIGYGLPDGFCSSRDQLEAIASSATGLNNGYRMCSTASIADGTWHHVCITFDDGADARIYIDGALDKTDAIVETASSSTSSLLIGRYQSSGFDISGEVDDFRLYTRQLSAGEVAEIANGDGCDRVLTGLALRYTALEQKPGDTVTSLIDLSPSGNDSGATSTPTYSGSPVLSCAR